MFNSKFYISLLDFYRFDMEHYVIGRNENMLRVKVKRHDGNHCNGASKNPQHTEIKYRNYWADRILQRESQSVTHAIVSDGIIDSMIHGFDNIILACGPHCSGKTFNITGWNRKCEGIAPRLIEDMLAVQTDGRWRGERALYAMSCVEIKDNRVFDLLNDDDDSNARRRSCLTKNVSKHEFDSPGTARRMLREASAKRTVTVRDDNEVPPTHVCDFIITFYCWHVSPGVDRATADSSCAKVHVVELAAVGPHDAKPFKYQIQTNRTALELMRFLERVNVKDDDAMRVRSGPATSALVNYCKASFSKRRTTLRVLCHIRPELEFLSLNLSVLKFGETLRKLKTSEISLPVSKSEATELQMRMEHLTHEMHLYGHLKGLKSMFKMTAARYARSRNDVLNYLKLKSDDIWVLRKWNLVDAYTVLSVFRKYYKKISTEDNNKKNVNHFKYGRFPLKSKSINKDATNKTAENTRQDVNKTLRTALCCDDDAPTDERRYYWDAFVAANSTVIVKRERILAKLRDEHRSFETALGHALDVQEELTRTRDSMDKLRRQRRNRGNEQLYDGDMNAIVPDAEKCILLSTRQVDVEMAKAHSEFIRAQTYLNRTMVDCSKLDDAIHAHFENFVQMQNEEMYTENSSTELDVKSTSIESPTSNVDSKTKSDETGKVKKK